MNQETVICLFDYRDGGLYWKQKRGSKAQAGCRAGSLLNTGYRSIHISGKRYQEHRLIFLLHYGFLPDQIDHINQIKSDNRIENLREANHSTNQMNTQKRNSSSGFRGVRFVEKTSRWYSRIYLNGKEIRIGTFATANEASAAYEKEAKKLFREFAG